MHWSSPLGFIYNVEKKSVVENMFMDIFELRFIALHLAKVARKLVVLKRMWADNGGV